MQMKTMRSLLFLILVLTFAIGVALAQAPAGGQGGRGGAGGGGGGGQARGGRGGGPQLTLTSPSFPDGGQIPVKHAQPTAMPASPEFKWTNVPMGTMSFVLLMHDPDVAQLFPDDVLHWLAWNIPGTASGLPENVPQGAKLPDGTQQVSLRGQGYMGPGAAATGPMHHYTFELFALDTMLDVQPAAMPAETRAAVMKAMVGHVRGKAVYVGLYHQPAQ
jgi:Raf kinase inhibitor-like YbhB/YbcL family protein